PRASIDATASRSARNTWARPVIADASRLTGIIRTEWLDASFMELTETGSKPARRQDSMQVTWYVSPISSPLSLHRDILGEIDVISGMFAIFWTSTVWDDRIVIGEARYPKTSG